MIRALACALAAGALAGGAWAADGRVPRPEAAPTATTADVVARAIQARGGLEPWRRIETMMWKGRLESERLPGHSVHFELTVRRPDRSRFEILDPSEKSLRVFDGQHGWKLHAGADGRPNLTGFSDREVRYAREAPGLDGPLLAFALQGKPFTLVGREKIDGHDCFRLSVPLDSGERQTIWVDAQTFLEVRYDRTAYGESGPKGIVSAYYRDYRVVEGLVMASEVELGGQAAGSRDRMIVESVLLNPKVPEVAFSRPPGVPQGHEVVIRPQPPLRPAANPGSAAALPSPEAR